MEETGPRQSTDGWVAAHGLAAETYVKCVTNSNPWRTSGSETGRDRELIHTSGCPKAMPETLENRTRWCLRREREGAQGLTLIAFWEMTMAQRREHGHPSTQISWNHPGNQWVTDVNARLSPSYYLSKLYSPWKYKMVQKFTVPSKSLLDTLLCVKEAVWWTWICKGKIVWWWCTSGYLKLTNLTAKFTCKGNLLYGVNFQMQIVLSTISVYMNNWDIYR